MKRRKFITNIAAGTGGTVVLGMPGISRACTRTGDLSESWIWLAIVLNGARMDQTMLR